MQKCYTNKNSYTTKLHLLSRNQYINVLCRNVIQIKTLTQQNCICSQEINILMFYAEMLYK